MFFASVLNVKCFKKTAGIVIFVLAVVFVSSSLSYAGYEFDDLMGNAYMTQWMVINRAGGTYGGKYDTPLVVIRAMSDKADGKAHDTYENMADIAADNSSRILIQMIEGSQNQ